MACTNCSTGSKDGSPKGCKNNGTCGTDSCNKLTVFDWLSNMSLPGGEAPFDCVEVRFKNGRKDFYRNSDNLTLSIGDIVATEASPGHDIGIVSLTGELVKIQMKKKKVRDNDDVAKIYRKASQKDIDIWSTARDREEPMKVIARELAIRLNLEMKISDIEFQGDASKATFYYTANDRVDFRQLIKDFAREFSTRIEMKQVGFRQEAARLGGVGSCGRELCCSTWLTDFRSVNTSAARYQQLSLNPQKLAGQCGKLKCCLNYELDTYLDALKELPDLDTKLYTEKGDAYCQKVDIFKGYMWFAYANDNAHWHMISAEQVKEMLEINKKKERITSLEEYVVEEEVAPDEIEKNFKDAVGQESLTRFDAPKRKKRPNNRKKKPATANGEGRQNKPRPKGNNANGDRKPAVSKEERSNKPRPKRNNTNGDRKPEASNEARSNKPANNANGEKRPPRAKGQKPAIAKGNNPDKKEEDTGAVKNEGNKNTGNRNRNNNNRNKNNNKNNNNNRNAKPDNEDKK